MVFEEIVFSAQVASWTRFWTLLAPLWRAFWPSRWLKTLLELLLEGPSAVQEHLFFDLGALQERSKRPPGALQDAFRRPRGSQRLPGSHFGSMWLPFGTHSGSILDPFFNHLGSLAGEKGLVAWRYCCRHAVCLLPACCTQCESVTWVTTVCVWRPRLPRAYWRPSTSVLQESMR